MNSAVAALSLSVVLSAAAEDLFVSDVINLSIRERPANDAGVIGQVSSGESVEVLESLGPQSFTRIRDANGREGWVTSRYLTPEPAARVQLEKAEAALAKSNRALSTLQVEFEAAQARLAKLESEGAELRALLDERAKLEAELRKVLAELPDEGGRVTAAIMDVPAAVVRRHLRARQAIPPSADEIVATCARALISPN